MRHLRTSEIQLIKEDTNEINAESEKHYIEMIQRIISCYKEMLERGIKVSDHLAVSGMHKNINRCLINISYENFNNKDYGVNAYYKLYEEIQIAILQLDLKENGRKYLGKYKPDVIHNKQKYIDNEKFLTLTVCGKHIINTYQQDFILALNKYGLSPKTLDAVVNGYLKINHNFNIDDDRNIKTKRKVLQQLLEFNGTKEEFCMINNLKVDYIDRLIKIFKEIDFDFVSSLKEKNQYQMQKRHAEAVSILERIMSYIENKIDYHNQKINFTALDYYTLTKIPPLELSRILAHSLRYRGPQYFFLKDYQSSLVNINEFKRLNHGMQINNVVITSDNIDEICDFLTLNEIPITYKVLNIALYRYACNIPILPLKDNNNMRKLRLNNLPN